MENEQKPVADLFIRQCIGFIIYRSIANLILRNLSKNQLTIENKFISSKDFWHKVSKGEYKKSILIFIKSLTSQKDDLMVEIMKQYEMTNFSDATAYHDIFNKIFNEGIEFVTDIIETGRYDLLVHMSQISQDGMIERRAQ